MGIIATSLQVRDKYFPLHAQVKPHTVTRKHIHVSHALKEYSLRCKQGSHWIYDAWCGEVARDDAPDWTFVLGGSWIKAQVMVVSFSIQLKHYRQCWLMCGLVGPLIRVGLDVVLAGVAVATWASSGLQYHVVVLGVRWVDGANVRFGQQAVTSDRTLRRVGNCVESHLLSVDDIGGRLAVVKMMFMMLLVRLRMARYGPM